MKFVWNEISKRKCKLYYKDVSFYHVNGPQELSVDSMMTMFRYIIEG